MDIVVSRCQTIELHSSFSNPATKGERFDFSYKFLSASHRIDTLKTKRDPRVSGVSEACESHLLRPSNLNVALPRREVPMSSAGDPGEGIGNAPSSSVLWQTAVVAIDVRTVVEHRQPSLSSASA